MTKEEAILVLQNDAYILYEDDSPYDRQAYNMAIKALEEKRIKTNADRIRSMSDEELSYLIIDNVDCNSRCKAWKNGCEYSDSTCRQAWLDWLKQECDYENK